jgi:hypothetical protein
MILENLHHNIFMLFYKMRTIVSVSVCSNVRKDGVICQISWILQSDCKPVVWNRYEFNL